MIGLKRYSVQLTDHDPDWSVIYQKEEQMIQRASEDLNLKIEHVGSTSVAGLRSKPIIDIATAIRSIDLLPTLIERLTTLGYIYRGECRGVPGNYLFVKESTPDVRIVHLHVVEEIDIQWQNYIQFRNILRTNAELRKRYADLKSHLATQFQEDRKTYTAAKNDFIKEVLAHK